MIGSQAEPGLLRSFGCGFELPGPPLQLIHHLGFSALEGAHPPHALGVHEDPVQAHAVARKSLQNRAKTMLEV
jgi:hypothetical protein